MDYKDVKSELLHEMERIVTGKIEETQRNINAAIESRNSDTKSSAGDKFETGREMIQMEINKGEDQLSKFRLLLHEIVKLKAQEVGTSIAYGSLVITNKGTYYFGVPLGKIELGQIGVVYCLSLASPIGKLFINKTLGSELSFNGVQYKITGIF